MIARIDYSTEIDLRFEGYQEEGTLNYESMGEPHCLTPSGKLYLDAILHHAQAFVDEGVYPLVVIFLPEGTESKWREKLGVPNLDAIKFGENIKKE